MSMSSRQSYIICATPRSGSTLLCDLLAGTGVAGVPDSFFRRESFVEWAEHFGVSTANWTDDLAFDLAYLRAVKDYGIGGTGMFGMRLMWESVGDLCARLGAIYPTAQVPVDCLRQGFDDPLFVHLSRGDKIAQAISLYRAQQSGLWHIHADGSERERLAPAQAPVYDDESLSLLVRKLQEQDASWSRWFVEQQIDPWIVSYEALADDPRGILAGLLSALGRDPAHAKGAQAATALLADSESRQWSARFRARPRAEVSRP